MNPKRFTATTKPTTRPATSRVGLVWRAEENLGRRLVFIASKERASEQANGLKRTKIYSLFFGVIKISSTAAGLPRFKRNPTTKTKTTTMLMTTISGNKRIDKIVRLDTFVPMTNYKLYVLASE